MMTSPTRWGICSSGKISQDFVGSLKALDSNQHQVVAVAAQDVALAQQFADTYSIPKAYGDYSELAQNPDVDVVYIGTIIPAHYDLCLMMFAAKKHVLCEKSLTLNADKAQHLITKAKESGVFLMEGFWTHFFPCIKDLMRRIADNEIGDVRVCSATFGAHAPQLARLNDKTLGGGVLLDMGCYPVMLANLVFGGEAPHKVVASGVLSETGVDETVSLALHYSGGKMAHLIGSYTTEMDNCASVSGTKGFIKFIHQLSPPCWAPTVLTAPSGVFDFPLPDVDHKFNFGNSVGLNYEAQHVRECLLAGKLESDVMPHSTTLNIIRVLDEARRQLGVTHDL